MATKRFIGGAAAVAQIDHVTPANVEIDDVFEITLADDAGNSAAISFTATAATVQDVVEGLQAAADAAKTAGTAPWDDVTVTEDDTKVIITADTAGVPFYVTTSTTNGGSTDDQTLSRSASTANSGPADWNTAANWSTGSIPANSDDVYIENVSQAITYGLDQSAVTLNSLQIAQSMTGQIGTAAAYLQIAASTVYIGYHYGPGTPTGSSLIKLDIGTTAANVVIDNTGTAATSTAAAVQLLANNAATDIIVNGGKTVSIAQATGETTTTINDIIASAGKIYVGSGVTMGDVTSYGADVLLACACTNAKASNGSIDTVGSGTITNFYSYNSASSDLESTGTITTLYGYGGQIDTTGSNRTRTITNCKLAPGCRLIYDPAIITLTNGIETIDTIGVHTFEVS